MASVLKQAVTVLSLFLPRGVQVINRWRKARKAFSPDIARLVAPNRELRNRHKGERCFILGNGPSAKKLDLTKLKGQIVISVSNGYLFPHYLEFAPLYHCVPQITYGLMTQDDTAVWFEEMHEGLSPQAEVFLSTNEARLVRDRGLFHGRTVRYLHLAAQFDQKPQEGLYDISKSVPSVYSVPIMTLMLAMYMGFTEIILLGVDHDQFLTTRYDYAFDLKAQKGKDVTLRADGTSAFSRYDEFRGLYRLWQQYRNIREVAEQHGIAIFNSTPGGALDEFPRVEFDYWFETSDDNTVRADQIG